MKRTGYIGLLDGVKKDADINSVTACTRNEIPESTPVEIAGCEVDETGSH